MSTTKQQFTSENETRRKEGLPLLTWAEYISDSPPKKLGRPRMEESEKKPQGVRTRRYLNFLPDEKKEIIRPSATYNNSSYQSIYDKYGI